MSLSSANSLSSSTLISNSCSSPTTTGYSSSASDLLRETALLRKRKFEETSSPQNSASPLSQTPVLFELSSIPSERLWCKRLRDYFPTSKSHKIEQLVMFNFVIDLHWLLCTELHHLVYGPNHASKIVIIGHKSAEPHPDEQTVSEQLRSLAQVEQQHGLVRLASIETGSIFMPKFSTAHSKLSIAQYSGAASGVRVLISTANLCDTDWNLRAQANFAWDFPICAVESQTQTEFGADLLHYLSHAKIQDSYLQPKLASFMTVLRRTDFSLCPVELLWSLPGERGLFHSSHFFLAAHFFLGVSLSSICRIWTPSFVPIVTAALSAIHSLGSNYSIWNSSIVTEHTARCTIYFNALPWRKFQANIAPNHDGYDRLSSN